MKRDDILSALVQAAVDLPWAVALWEGGSASFGRDDEWSDIDLGLAVVPGHVAEGFAVMEAALRAI